MAKLREDTKTELEFAKLLQELRDLNLYDLSGRISTAFYDQSFEQYVRGSNMVNEHCKL
jgi:hypothetical protein